jgi:hypothetical protein
MGNESEYQQAAEQAEKKRQVHLAPLGCATGRHPERLQYPICFHGNRGCAGFRQAISGLSRVGKASRGSGGGSLKDGWQVAKVLGLKVG